MSKPFDTFTVVSHTAIGDVMRREAPLSFAAKNSASSSLMSIAQNADASTNIGDQSS
jgi:hypothetical protein